LCPILSQYCAQYCANIGPILLASRELINGNGKLTETENVIFYVSYGILTDERNFDVLLQRSTEIRLRINGNVNGGNES